MARSATKDNGAKAAPPANRLPAETPPQESLIIDVPPLQIRRVAVRIVGDSPLLLHQFAEKAKGMMRDKQMGKAQAKKSAKAPMDEWNGARYLLPGKVDAIPAISFKRAAVDACRSVEGVTMVSTKGALHINRGQELLPILNPDVGEPYSGPTPSAIENSQSDQLVPAGTEFTPTAPKLREDVCRVGMGTADLRYRPVYWPWAVDLDIAFDADVISPEKIVNLLTRAGLHVGVGEWRPSSPKRTGEFGLFHAEAIPQ